MSITTRLLGLTAAAVLAPAAAASAATFTGTTAQGAPITFDAEGEQVSHVVSSLAVACTGRAGIEPFQPSGTFVANGAESKLSELRPSAVLNRDVTQNLSLTATITGTQASGSIAVNYSTSDFDVFTSTTRITVCTGSIDFTAAAPAAPAPSSKPTPKSKPKPKPKKAKPKKKRHAHHPATHALKVAGSSAVVPQA